MSESEAGKNEVQPEQGTDPAPSQEDRAKCDQMLKALKDREALAPHGMSPGQIIGNLALAFSGALGPKKIQ